MEREATKLIDTFDTIKISLLHIDSIRCCVICMVKFEVEKDACQMFCHKTHIFHVCLLQ